MSTAPSSATVLVVDDDLGLLRLIQRALEREGFTVVPASSGQEAIAWLAENRADLMLLDLKLQDIEGREVISQPAIARRVPPFIIITGQGDERVAVDMMKHGALDYLVKDVKFIEFVPTVVRRALARIREQERLAGAEEALRESEERYRQMVHALPAAAYTCDAQGRITLYNDAAAKLWGREPKIGHDRWCGSHRLYTPDGEPLPLARCPMAMAVSQGEPIRDAELIIERPDGSRVHVLAFPEPIHDSSGAVTGAVNMLLDITERRRLERELIDISERERTFGQDLHDGLGQVLTGLEMLSHGLTEDLKSKAPALAKQAQKLNRELRGAVTQTRLISHSLAPVPMQGEGLMQGLMQLAASTSQIPKVACRFLCDPPVLIHDVATATHLYRIAQEAVNNALKHGRAKRIRITLSEGSEGTTLAIENNGGPIPAADPPNRGMGLNVMRYRAGSIGAALSVESIKRKGVCVTCTLPLKKS